MQYRAEWPGSLPTGVSVLLQVPKDVNHFKSTHAHNDFSFVDKYSATEQATWSSGGSCSVCKCFHCNSTGAETGINCKCRAQCTFTKCRTHAATTQTKTQSVFCIPAAFPAIFLVVILKGNLTFLPLMTSFVLYTKESFCVYIYTPLNLAPFTQHMFMRPSRLSHLQ